MARLSDIFRNLFARSSGEDRVASYVIREHQRGRTLAEILDDPYVKNRCSAEQTRRLLDRPEIIRAIGEDTVAETRASR